MNIIDKTFKSTNEARASHAGEFYVMARNRGMWGGMTSPVVGQDGEVIYYKTRAEAEAAARRYREDGGRINNFNSYFVEQA